MAGRHFAVQGAPEIKNSKRQCKEKIMLVINCAAVQFILFFTVHNLFLNKFRQILTRNFYYDLRFNKFAIQKIVIRNNDISLLNFTFCISQSSFLFLLLLEYTLLILYHVPFCQPNVVVTVTEIFIILKYLPNINLFNS